MPQVALVTGCSSGLGRALCYCLDRQISGKGEKAFTVVATARKLSSIQELKEDGMLTESLDVSQLSSVQKVVAKVVSAQGRIDLLICNAGTSCFGPLVEQPLEDVQRVIDTNLFGVLRMVQAVAPTMIKQRSGVVVCIGSVSAYMSTPYAGAYSSSKAALHVLSETLRMELAPFGIQVATAVAGSIKSSFSDNAAATGGGIERYSSHSSAYNEAAEGIKDRIYVSQRDPGIATAEATAEAIVKQIGGSRVPPYIRCGGNWWKFTVLGFIQKWVWPVLIFWLFTRHFKLNVLGKR